MNTIAPTHHQITDAVNNLPADVLSELADYILYLQHKNTSPEQKKDALKTFYYPLQVLVRQKRVYQNKMRLS